MAAAVGVQKNGGLRFHFFYFLIFPVIIEIETRSKTGSKEEKMVMNGGGGEGGRGLIWVVGVEWRLSRRR